MVRQPPYEYNGFVLDDFQAEAIWHIQRGISTLVGAPTGTGKTLIADYLVGLCLDEGKRIIYCAPIKALVNQKYREFSERFGPDRAGITTGDVVRNPGGAVVVMTTEVLRNMLLQDDEKLADVGWVIFDEIHYLSHEFRGTAWEEAILLLDPQVPVLGLSATVPNMEEIADWMGEVKGNEVVVVECTERAVPLVHKCYRGRKLVHMPDVKQKRNPGREGHSLIPSSLDDPNLLLPDYAGLTTGVSDLDVVSYLARHRLFPCLYFVFSRRGCEEKAFRLARRSDYLHQDEKRAVQVTVRQKLAQLNLKQNQVPLLSDIYPIWLRGIGFHHAGLLPAVKQIVEALLERRLLKVLYATETFAVGVNMPVRTVCFDSLEKFDGRGKRPLTHREYFQMAGRAGRRGLDRQGTVISACDVTGALLLDDERPVWDDSGVEPVISQMDVSFNLVLNLLKRFEASERESFFRNTLASYQFRRGGQGTGCPPAEALRADFEDKRVILERLQYVAGEDLLPRGQICCGIYVCEIMVTELIFSGLLDELPPEEVCGLAAAIIYDPGDDRLLPAAYSPPSWAGQVNLLQAKLAEASHIEAKRWGSVYPAVSPVVVNWARGKQLQDVLRDTEMDPGDLVNLCRQVIDLLRQVIKAVDSPGLRRKLEGCITLLDRDMVRVMI